MSGSQEHHEEGVRPPALQHKPVEHIDFSFQATTDLKDSFGNLVVPYGEIYPCCISKTTTHDMGLLCCHYAKVHGLDDNHSSLRFYNDTIGFNWSLYPDKVNNGDKDVDNLAGATIKVSQDFEHVCFWTKATESLFTVRNNETEKVMCVKEGMLYSCVMLHGQRFSSLFRHYARYHNLNGEDFEYRFNGNLIDPKDTPRTLGLELYDVVEVRARRKRAAQDDPA
mmetsp:Transcript_14625/g.23014  ORF Transcript_14625/g.23014 Transcript_14625/m.23014 type:complete len:224 (+) Transcript_14625:124-795(+)|eukprot:CAMPEP_0117014876 /NCGR_PEP_ID=MMETSP0472-20121206/11988_1 /TAXON_ID=693140 ORGANISM="Tiarina fusus, Strain LIS" /NCGR_SAMPLE_ID=MMETSP0472 /ASSEMBLY_ACC=CAM_ASM_000603 /LENGTH=223 /DNA_ID=CAMNT_0004718547 /DNA_START=124 /DNA_END=795 /DNA_ORIENTATION=+